MEIEEDPVIAPKKKSTLLPLIVGIGAAMAIVGFFGWKIASPYLASSDRGGNDRDAFAPIAATAPRPQPFNESPAAVQGAPAPAAIAMPQGAPVEPRVAQVGASSQAVPQPQPQPVAQAGYPTNSSAPAAAAGRNVNMGQAPAMADKSTPQVSQPSPVSVSAEELSQINKRIDGLGAALAALKQTVERLQTEMQKPRVAAVSKTAVSQAAPAKHAATAAASKKPAPAMAAGKKLVESGEPDVAGKPDGDLQLQAVLQDRAWFKTRTGETVTVSPGEEVKGVGVVKQIDVDSGRVVFSNGAVYR